jgi:hypothetical protein
MLFSTKFSGIGIKDREFWVVRILMEDNLIYRAANKEM